MGYRISTESFDRFLTRLQSKYRIYGPVLEPGGGSLSDTDRVIYREIDRFSDLVLDQKSYFSPKEILYPIRETLFHFVDDQCQVPEIDDRKIAILLRPCDINGIDRLDTIFLENGPAQDFYYKRRRDKLAVFMIECTSGFENCWCVSVNANTTDRYDLAFRFGEETLVEVKNEEFRPYFSELPETDFTAGFVTENAREVHLPKVEAVSTDLFAHPLWQQYSSRCIACGRCNTSCITCSCFTMQDVTYGTDKKLGERRRRWAGCQIDGFTDMAGGHKFREHNGEKMRFKTMHKIHDYYRRFGKHQCVGCGRCDDVCPQYISFARCIDTLARITREGESR